VLESNPTSEIIIYLIRVVWYAKLVVCRSGVVVEGHCEIMKKCFELLGLNTLKVTQKASDKTIRRSISGSAAS
jgi:hypothetical protein